MNVTLVSLEALLLKATHESLPCPDAPALEAFCSVMRDSSEGPQLAAQTLSNRIHTQNAREALLALSTVDRCMRKCGPAFHAEIGKFRFLNEMIKLVSPKYFANRTAPEVQTKVLQLLHAWSIEYPKESKFKVAYDMLKNQGVIKETPPPLPPEDVVVSPRNKNAIFEDEEKSKLLQKLLQSKKPEDLQHANRLIKSMVREEERRTEANFRRAHEVACALDSAGLLQDMLRHANAATPDELQLIRELFARCARLRPTLQRLAAATTSQDNLDDILSSIDLLDEVGEQYKQCMQQQTKKEEDKPTNESLLDFAGAPTDGDKVSVVQSPAIDELGDIFSAKDGPSNIAEPLKPVNLMSNGKESEDVDLLGEKPAKTEGWNELDSLGAQLLRQSLPDSAKRLDNFNSKPVKKVPMNELEKLSPKQSEVPKNGAFDLDFFTKKPEIKPSPIEIKNTEDIPVSPNDDVMVDITENAAQEEIKKYEIKSPVTTTVEPLTDVYVDLASVTRNLSLVAYKEDGGVTVTLEFCKDKPRGDVSVVVVVTTNNGQFEIEDYKFQPVVPKGCKVRLLAPTGTTLPRYNPYESPSIKQIMLIARPAHKPPVNLKFVITYSSQDEPCSEIGEVARLPLDDI
ncbi:ADP-ribosylation factor-binding protein GGA2 [Leguminivora glycinivorella]|uniref:ADP-ribosylation factor-binding protein GGA2 n=1 Tax=Leguminivora glycinivorella TaxID=1035111 RepID=UPI00200EE10E|nr:ADP-ribosylation factor-binding protein GGA2 [Leguminivora glycinivorella]